MQHSLGALGHAHRPSRGTLCGAGRCGCVHASRDIVADSQVRLGLKSQNSPGWILYVRRPHGLGRRALRGVRRTSLTSTPVGCARTLRNPFTAGLWNGSSAETSLRSRMKAGRNGASQSEFFGKSLLSSLRRMRGKGRQMSEQRVGSASGRYGSSSGKKRRASGSN